MKYLVSILLLSCTYTLLAQSPSLPAEERFAADLQSCTESYSCSASYVVDATVTTQLTDGSPVLTETLRMIKAKHQESMSTEGLHRIRANGVSLTIDNHRKVLMAQPNLEGSAADPFAAVLGYIDEYGATINLLNDGDSRRRYRLSFGESAPMSAAEFYFEVDLGVFTRAVLTLPQNKGTVDISLRFDRREVDHPISWNDVFNVLHADSISVADAYANYQLLDVRTIRNKPSITSSR